MPVATITEINRLEHLQEYLLKWIGDNADDLGFNFVGGYDEPITTAYPSVILGTGNSTKEVHGTHTFLVQMMLDIYIGHAEATEDHRTRSHEMLKLVTSLVEFLESDLTLTDRIIFGYVVSERPGLLRPRTNPGIFVVSTVINYQATLETRF